MEIQITKYVDAYSGDRLLSVITGDLGDLASYTFAAATGEVTAQVEITWEDVFALQKRFFQESIVPEIEEALAAQKLAIREAMPEPAPEATEFSAKPMKVIFLTGIEGTVFTAHAWLESSEVIAGLGKSEITGERDG